MTTFGLAVTANNARTEICLFQRQSYTERLNALQARSMRSTQQHCSGPSQQSIEGHAHHKFKKFALISVSVPEISMPTTSISCIKALSRIMPAKYSQKGPQFSSESLPCYPAPLSIITDGDVGNLLVGVRVSSHLRQNRVFWAFLRSRAHVECACIAAGWV